jgi:NAD kinase
MKRLTENKLILVLRETRLEELKARFNTVAQARFYVERLGADFSDYEKEHAAYEQAVAQARQALSQLGRLQLVPRALLPNFLFGPEDVVVAIGQDGLVANTLKYLRGQPLVGVNPDPKRYDGQLLPFQPRDLPKLLPEVLRERRPIRTVTMAKAELNNGQTLYAVNDLFIGPKSHGSARYVLRHDGRAEQQSSSGVIVSTGLGSTGWFASLIAGARGVAQAADILSDAHGARQSEGVVQAPIQAAWDAPHLFFTVREPFPSRSTRVGVVFGQVSDQAPLEIESFMPERGVIFSDGIENDFLDFNAGSRVKVMLAEHQGRLVC